jgi:hypothetical protein
MDLNLSASGTGSVTINQIKTNSVTGEVIPGKLEGTNFTDSLLIGHSTTGTLDDSVGNTGVGIRAMISLTTGDSNTSLGTNSLKLNTGGRRNVMIGVNSGDAIITGHENTAVGTFSLSANVTSIGNTALGYQALETTTGAKNIAIGHNSGDNITSGNGNVIIGSIDADSATGDKQLIIADGVDGSVAWLKGDSAGLLTITGGEVIPGKKEGTNFSGSLLIGHSNHGTLNAASFNTGVGATALTSLTTGDRNTMLGHGVGTLITTASDNTAVGRNALRYLATGGGRNVAIGVNALTANSNFEENTAVGTYALEAVTGDVNIGLGVGAGRNITSGSGNVIIGEVGAPSATGDRQLVIAGHDGTTRTTWISGDSSGNITVPAGIHIGGTGDANKLDDYEEGSHVVTMTDTGGGATITPHNSYKTLAYVKVGRLVHVQGVLLVSAISGTMSGTLKITLPFASATISAGAGRSYLTLGAYNVDFTAGTSPYGAVAQGQSYFACEVSGDSIGGGQYRVSTSSQIYVAGTYYASA